MASSHLRALAAVPILAVVTTGIAHAQSVLRRIDGSAVNDFAGISVAIVQDADGDEFDDLLVGIHGADLAGENAGAARLYSGRTGGLLFEWLGSAAGDLFGRSVADAGDVDGDGRSDVIIGAPFADVGGDSTGSASVFSGRSGALIVTLHGAAAGDCFGIDVAGAGDVDGDGFGDFIVGAYGDDTSGVDAGAASIHSGRTHARLHALYGEAAGDRFGFAVARAGDVNADGYDDVIVGAHGADFGGVDAGAAYVFSGRNGTRLFRFVGDQAGDLFGYAVGGAGLVDTDAHADVIVGGWGSDAQGHDAGMARVFSGADGSTLHSFAGLAADDCFGFAVAGVGDVNGDGRADLIVGAYGHDAQGSASGMVRLFSGADGAVLHTFVGSQAGDRFGHSVAGGGDVDGDGYADPLAGAPNADFGGSNSGSLFVMDLGGSGTPPIARIFGRACVGSNGYLPQVELGGSPAIGGWIEPRLRGVLPATPCVMNLGAVTLVPLGPFGMRGCTIYATLDGFNLPGSADATGMRSFGVLPIPNDPDLLGLPLVMQAVAFDAQANPIGYTLSNALRMTFGT